MHCLILPFTNNMNSTANQSLLLALLGNGCSFEQARKILSIQEYDLQSYVAKAFGRSKNIHSRIRKSLSDEICLKIWMILKNGKDEIKSQFFKRCLYPCCLCMFTFVSLVFFRSVFVPNIKSLLDTSEFYISFFYLDLLLSGLTLIYLSILVSIITLVTALKSRSLQNFTYLKLHHRFRNNFLTVYTSRQFSTLLLACISNGISTQTSLEVITKFNNLPFVVYLAQDCMTKLSSGQSFVQSVVTLNTDQAFKTYIQLGLYSNQVIDQLDHYVKFSALHIEKLISYFINALYIYVYIQFFLSALTLYRIIQIPLTILGTKF